MVPFLDIPVLLPALTPLVISLLFFGLVGLILSNEGSPFLASLRTRWICYLGKISYGLYLYHYILLYLFAVLVKRLHWSPSWWLDLVMTACFVLCAAASWEWIEKPILRLKQGDGEETRP